MICSLDDARERNRLTSFPTACSGAAQRRTYVLLTAAHNEESYIEQTIVSVLSQTVLPSKWIIVSDASVDGTDKIVESYASKHDFIRFLRVARPPVRSFGSKIVALRLGNELLRDVTYNYIGNMDADIQLDTSYFEDLLAHFENCPRLGIASGYVYDRTDHGYRECQTNRTYSVAHGAQLVRKECYQAIGGYAVLQHGGEDWHAQISALMYGWTAEAFPRLHILHNRPTGEGGNLVRYKFREGRMDYSFGSDPFFEILKCAQRIPQKPVVLGATARLAGFIWSWLCRERRPVSDEFVAFLRSDQRRRLMRLFAGSRTMAMGASGSNNDRLIGI